ncbi:Cytochrome P450 1A1 [Orchesella cincta]|uniref:Cytochrome P450 1A1 n=1 Tax=Orchesella cincta TaxID=48709 RepID=A0A1D2M7T4_ORCCI|nr:Cytochrome P450 1A1 [Orchesella cincta]
MLSDLLQTGTTTTNGTLNYGLLFLTLNPDIQKKCQADIDAIVLKHLTPTLEDVEKMPYFQAFVLETHRLGNIVPNPIPRTCPKDWRIRGYTIPKGSIIFSNHYSVHMDKEYWGDPEVFRPDRFINEKGEFVLDKRVCHFGFGKRICIGITLSNAVIPIFIATLLQNFNLSCVPGQKPPTTET